MLTAATAAAAMFRRTRITRTHAETTTTAHGRTDNARHDTRCVRATTLFFRRTKLYNETKKKTAQKRTDARATAAARIRGTVMKTKKIPKIDPYT